MRKSSDLLPSLRSSSSECFDLLEWKLPGLVSVIHVRRCRLNDARANLLLASSEDCSTAPELMCDPSGYETEDHRKMWMTAYDRASGTQRRLQKDLEVRIGEAGPVENGCPRNCSLTCLGMWYTAGTCLWGCGPICSWFECRWIRACWREKGAL